MRLLLPLVHVFKWVVFQEWEASASAQFGVVLGIGSTANNALNCQRQY